MHKGLLFLIGLIILATPLAADTVETTFLRADLDPANQVPAVTGVGSFARATVAVHARRNDAGEVISGSVSFDVQYLFESPVQVTGLHIHPGAAGENGPTVIETAISSADNLTASGGSVLFRFVNVPGGAALDALKDLLVNPGNYYVNLHTSDHPAGLMRDQLRFSPPPPPSMNAVDVMNNAGYLFGSSAAMAPGTIVAIFGTRLNDGRSCIAPTCGPSFGTDGKLGTTMTGAQVTVNGVAVPILYAVWSQLGIQLPYELTGTSATLVITVGGVSSDEITIPIAPVSPGIFTFSGNGIGAAAITHADNTPVTPQNPAKPGDVVILYATGLGQVTPAVPTGMLPAGATRTVTQAEVTIDGINAEVQFSGISSCCVGLNQVNLVVPPASRSDNELPVVLRSGDATSNPATIAVGQSASANPVPTITSLSPSSINLDTDDLTLTISGTGFTLVSTVTLNGVAKTATYVSDTQLTIPVTFSDLTGAGDYPVVVTNPAPGGGSSSSFILRVRPAPGGDSDDY